MLLLNAKQLAAELGIGAGALTSEAERRGKLALDGSMTVELPCGYDGMQAKKGAHWRFWLRGDAPIESLARRCARRADELAPALSKKDNDMQAETVTWDDVLPAGAPEIVSVEIVRATPRNTPKQGLPALHLELVAGAGSWSAREFDTYVVMQKSNLHRIQAVAAATGTQCPRGPSLTDVEHWAMELCASGPVRVKIEPKQYGAKTYYNVIEWLTAAR